MILSDKHNLSRVNPRLAVLSNRIYWKKVVSLFDHVTSFPAHFNRQETQRIVSLPINLDPLVNRYVEKASDSYPLSEFVLFISGLAVWLHRFTGDARVVLAVPDMSASVGKTCLLCLEVDGQSTFQKLVLSARQQLIQAIAHSPNLEPTAPFFGVDYSELPPRAPLSSDFLIRFSKSSVGYSGEVRFDANVFDILAIKRKLENLTFVYQQLFLSPDQSIDKIDLLNKGERSWLLKDCNSLKFPCVLDKTIGEIFEDQVTKTPDRIAAFHGSEKISYRQLNERANQIARSLQETGVGKREFVALLHPRNIHFLGALLAILKSGAVYVPIDPDYPKDRVDYMLSNSGAKTVISALECLPLLAGKNEVRYALLLDAEKGSCSADFEIIGSEKISAQLRDNLPIEIASSDLAYMIYTSGSTGEPKGAMIRHDGAVNHILAQFEALQFHMDTAFLQSAPSSSDISVWQFLAPLLIGGKTIIVDKDDLCDGARLLGIIQKSQITLIELVPSVLSELLRAAELAGPKQRGMPCLEFCMATGEEVSVQLVNQWLKLYPEIPLVNAYGPTEASDDICQAVIRSPLSPEQKSVSIGKPLANLNLYVLDKSLTLLPPGAVGEICVSGVGVGAGYWKNREKTEAAFVSNPYAEEKTHSTLYRTGDLGRWRPDASLEFLGRLDQQVKLRGYRIELGEIEAAVSLFDDVQEAVVLLLGEDAARLIAAFVILKSCHDKTAFSESLKKHLESKLPGPMVPSLICVLDSFPRMGNGKVDRRALPQLIEKVGMTELQEPETEQEKKMARIWSEILKKKIIGKRDNFFALGGDSISSMQVVSRARQEGLNISVAQVFQFPVLENLSAQASSHVVKGTLSLGTERREFPLTPVQAWFFERNFFNPNHYNQSVMLNIAPGVDIRQVRAAWEMVVRHHPSLHTYFVKTETGWNQRIRENANSSFEVVRLEAASEDEMKAEISRITKAHQSSLDLGGTLCKALFFDCGNSPGRLLFTVHHLIVDGVSWRILLEDLEKAYFKLSRNVLSDPLAISCSVGEWTHYCHNLPNRDSILAQLKYWVRELNGGGRDLPVENRLIRTPGEKQFSQQELQFSKEMTARLFTAPRTYKAGTDDLLLAAFVRAVLEYSKEDRLLLEMEGHGRHWESPDLSRTVGWFTTLFPVLISLPPKFEPGIDLAIVKDKLRSVPDRGIGFGLLRYGMLGNEARQKLNGLEHPRICFNYLGQFDNLFSNEFFLGEATEKIENQSASENGACYDWEINAMISGGILKVIWTYNSGLHSDQTISGLLEKYTTYIHKILEHCEAPGAGVATTSDFPGARLSAEKLGSFMKKLQKAPQS
ncbi:MAG: non-ribosomal peptide synthase/amino acid adenylation enzyme [Verrucomicrobiales bacterium]|nr:non-ribosomal peptide synthase/amino acid adenylation enzyme [Verrucomicrobiales bacterium]